MNKVTDIEEAMKFANEDNSNEKPTVKHEESTDNLTKSSKIVKNEKNDFTTSLLDKTEYFNYQFNYCYPIFLTLNACICSWSVALKKLGMPDGVWTRGLPSGSKNTSNTSGTKNIVSIRGKQ